MRSEKGYWLNVYEHGYNRSGKPVNIGTYGQRFGNPEVPEWMKDDVLPRCMSNGFSYKEMVSFIEMHDSDAWQITDDITEKGGADAASQELWRSWIEQGFITTCFERFLKEIQKNYEKAESEDSNDGKRSSWLADRVLPKSDYGLSYQELLDWIGHYDDGGVVVVDCICDSGLMENGLVLYQNWILGERICSAFQSMLEAVIKDLEGIMDANPDGPPWKKKKSEERRIEKVGINRNGGTQNVE